MQMSNVSIISRLFMIFYLCFYYHMFTMLTGADPGFKKGGGPIYLMYG